MGDLRPMNAHNNLHSLLYTAKSAEQMALCLQAFKLARHALLDRLNEMTFRSPAVVLDLDETVLDNSPYQAWLIKSGSNYHSSSWNSWCDEARANSTPGSVEFIQFAAENGVTAIFITSRRNVTRSGTAKNLHKLGLLSEEELAAEIASDGRPEHALQTRLFMKGMPSIPVDQPSGEQTYPLGNKFLQRVFCKQVRGFEIVLSVGDNLGDYAEYYGSVLGADGTPSGPHPLPNSRRDFVHQDATLFGRDFVLVPNCTYGGWLRAYEANKYGASDELAYTPAAVRQPLCEPQSEFDYGGEEPAKPDGPKFSEDFLNVWQGP